jgi:hypothetical protein
MEEIVVIKLSSRNYARDLIKYFAFILMYLQDNKPNVCIQKC